MSEFSSNNLIPTSFDVTPLLNKLKAIEGDTINQKNINTIQQVKLIELDPYTHTSTQIKTRLFLAVAYGINVVVAQLVALELGKINDDNGDNNTEKDEDDELEWLDVSDDRILLTHKINNENESVVIYPPSLAESLPMHIGTPKTDNKEDNNGKFTSNITSCALIPSPTVQTVCTTPTNSSGNTTSELIVQRTVAVMIGTSHDQVFSLLLNVTTCTTADSNVRFALEYDECKTINNGELKDDMDDKTTNYPCVHQILPSSKSYSTGRRTAIDNEDERDENLDKHVQIFHPSLQSIPQQQNDKELSKFSGIKSITFRRDNTKSTIYGLGGAALNTVNQDIVWITYGNGTMVKLPSWRPFLAVTNNDTNMVDSDVVIDSTNNINGSTVIPFDNSFQSPLDVPPPQTNNRHGTKDNTNTLLTQEGTSAEYWSIVSSAVSSLNKKASQSSHQQADPKAVVLAGQSASISTPPIAFNSTRTKFDPSSSSSAHGSTIGDASVNEETMSRRDQYQSNVDMALDDEQFGPVTGTVVEGTAAIVKGALKLGLGAVRWGLGSGGGVNEEHFNDDDTDEFMDAEDTVNHHSTNSRKGLKRGDVHDLVPWPFSSACFPFSDLPRKFETAVVDPTGSLMATTDNLGRVILFDLETNQPIRMFKGMRNVSCYFTELPCYDRHDKTSISTRLYLVIHLKQRGTVEVYRLQQGPRVSVLSVPQQKDCVVIECHGPPSDGSRVGCCLLEKINEGSSHFIVDQIIIDDPTVLVATSAIQHKQVKPMPSSENKQQLRILMQLLASTNIQSNAQTILTTYKSITSLADLGEGLDALSKCNRIEEEMNIDGSTLQSQAISYCKTRLDSAKKTEAHEGSGLVRKDAIASLEVTLAYHERLVNSYNILHRYETRNGLGSTRLEDEEVTDNNALSSWASEAMNWISLSSKNDMLNRRFTTSSSNVSNKDEDKPLQFFKFASACQSKDDRVYLTKIKRSRLPILKRCFRPLLQDLFVFKVVNDMFSNLGLDQDFDVQEQYFGEWISSLSTQTIARSNIMSGTWRPMTRWLQDIILSSYDSRQEKDKQDDDDVMLSSLMKYCSEMEDLPKAFLLSVICLDAVSSASMQLEQKTYGSITQANSVRPWEEMLRKLRVSLLVSCRLDGDVNPIGMSDPMTIKNVSRLDMFSAYAWIARDELSNSNDDQVTIATEVACLSSSEAFYPSTVDGDTAENKETMFESCNNSHLLTPDNIDTTRSDSSRSLLFYMKDHAQFPDHLAANRALILSSMWGKSPQSIHLLSRTMSTLQILVDSVEVFSLATLVEIYQSQLRPVCRALLFGFGEHELSEEVVLPLIEDRVWLGEFITAVKLILSMIIECASKVPKEDNEYGSNGIWPELRECCVLNILVKRLRNVQLSSVELHHMVLFSYELTGNSPVQEENLFLVGSLFSEMSLPKGSPEQQELLDKAIHDKAVESSNPVVDSFSVIHDVELFGKSLGISNSYVRTQYLLQMIKLGKDASINDLLGSSISSLDKETFVEETVEIVTVRLHATIQKLKQTQNYRGVLSLLDADASRWIREVVAQTPQDEYATASLIATHSLIMRVQGMSNSLKDDDMTQKIDALCMMSGTLLKAVQSHEQESVMSL